VSAHYADLEIRILALQDEGYPVEVTFSGEQEFPLAPLTVPVAAGHRGWAMLLHGLGECSRAFPYASRLTDGARPAATTHALGALALGRVKSRPYEAGRHGS